MQSSIISNSGTEGGGVQQACASCKHQRKKCNEDCVLAPYFPADRNREFQAVHKVFGVSNVMKLVRSVEEEDRQSVADSLTWEALCRQKDPILGPLGEYRKAQEELNFFKALHNQNQLVQNGWNVPNSIMNTKSSNGIAGGELLTHNSMFLNYNHENNTINPIPYTYVQDVVVPEHYKENMGTRLVSFQQQQQQHHVVGGFNQKQIYIPGQFGVIKWQGNE